MASSTLESVTVWVFVVFVLQGGGALLPGQWHRPEVQAFQTWAACDLARDRANELKQTWEMISTRTEQLRQEVAPEAREP